MEYWNDRPQITANLLNPAFCGIVPAVAIQSYAKHSSKGMSYTLVSLVLPMVLPQITRNSLPTTTATKFYLWVRSNEHVLIDFPKRVQELQCYTNESILFLMGQEWVCVDENGLFHYVHKRKNLLTSNDECDVPNILKSAKMLGKWFSVTGTDSLIYSYLKIRP